MIVGDRTIWVSGSQQKRFETLSMQEYLSLGISVWLWRFIRTGTPSTYVQGDEGPNLTMLLKSLKNSLFIDFFETDYERLNLNY